MTFRKNKILLGFFCLLVIGLLFASPVFGVFYGFYIYLWYSRNYIEIQGKKILYHHGILFSNIEEIKIEKVNKIECGQSITNWGYIKIFSGNDKPIIFDNIEKVFLVKNTINQLLDDN